MVTNVPMSNIYTSKFSNSFNLFLKFFFVSALCFSMSGCEGQLFGMLNPKGIVAFKERKLFFDTLALMLIVVIPVIIMSFAFVYHYQVSHRVRDYKPNWSHSFFLESIWWSIPCAIIVVLATLTWKNTHALDPYSRIPGHPEQPMIIQAIALPWKWLFIYPEQNIATVNYLAVPVNRQVEYWITADNVPMSAFFIPQLGSQIYAMAGMRTRLHLLGTHTGTFTGLNTMYNGEGFSDMKFPVHVVDVKDMEQWITTMKNSPNQLTDATYSQLLNQSINDQPQFFSGVPSGLFDKVIATYMDSVGPNHPRQNQLKLHYAI